MNKQFKLILGLVTIGLLFTGCLKSLQPFYTYEQLIDGKEFQGLYQVKKSEYWLFLPFNYSNIGLMTDDPLTQASFSFEYTASDDPNRELTEDDYLMRMNILVQLKDSTLAANIYESYLNGGELDEFDLDEAYLAGFFNFQDRIYLDITPASFFGDNSFSGRHHVPIHSLSLIDDMREENGSLQMQFLKGSKIEDLIKEDKVRIKHESVVTFPSISSDDQDLVLTDNTENLQKFLQKLTTMIDESYFERAYRLKKVR